MNSVIKIFTGIGLLIFTFLVIKNFAGTTAIISSTSEGITKVAKQLQGV